MELEIGETCYFINNFKVKTYTVTSKEGTLCILDKNKASIEEKALFKTKSGAWLYEIQREKDLHNNILSKLVKERDRCLKEESDV